jgi:hypothetical protein
MTDARSQRTIGSTLRFSVYIVAWTVGEIGTIISLLAIAETGPVPLVFFGCVWGLAFWMADANAERSVRDARR